ncbi:MAG: MFS transporter [Paenibacillaceae bacterium]|uniref:MFS transporter n=1 Tax=Paenibacillus mellifer TaxID=2937794 RepID=A0A9X2BQM8_9BACL|nr:MFS transporter [Paenibacillus mellifer]MBW4838611.1 MFS transporter [Paenibacillaceae bacterium]MCK8488478.1 MFS transporter [Paenibacillus mellifer]
MNFPWKRNLYVLWLGVFFCSTAYSMVIPFMSLFIAHDLGVTEHLTLWSGIAFGITFLAGALISPYWGSLSDKYGRKPMLLRSGFALSAVYLLYFFVKDPYQLIAVRILSGLLAGYVPSAIALVATNTPEKHVGYSLGIMSTAGAAGGIIGPLVGGSLSKFIGYRESFLASGCVVLISALIALIFVKEQNFDRNRERSHVLDDLKEASANRPLMGKLFVVLIVTASVMVLEPLLSLYVLDLGASASNASFSSGIIFSAVGISTVIAAPLWGKIGERIGYRNTLMIGLIGGGVGNILQHFFHSLIGFGTLRFVYGLFFAAVFPALNALIVQATKPEFRGRAFSLNQSASQLGNMVGPIAGGALGGWISIPVVFVLNGVLLSITAATLRFKSRFGSGRSEEQELTDTR